MFEASWRDTKRNSADYTTAKEHQLAATVAVKVFRASGNLASYLQRVYHITSAADSHDSSGDMNVSGPPPLHEVLRTYIRDHHHHKSPPPSEDEELEEEEVEEEEFIEDDDDHDASLSTHDANEPGVYAARELLGMFLVSHLEKTTYYNRSSSSHASAVVCTFTPTSCFLLLLRTANVHINL